MPPSSSIILIFLILSKNHFTDMLRNRVYKGIPCLFCTVKTGIVFTEKVLSIHIYRALEPYLKKEHEVSAIRSECFSDGTGQAVRVRIEFPRAVGLLLFHKGIASGHFLTIGTKGYGYAQ